MSHAPFCVQNTVTTPRGIARTSSYNSICQLVQVATIDTTEEEPAVELQRFRYDEAGRMVHSVKGRDVFAYYDQEQEQRVGGRFGTARFGSATTYDYNKRGLVTAVRHNGVTSEYEHDEEGNLTRFLDPNGHLTEYEYYNVRLSST